jgi:O-antigen/teichoic acid export membrane protein
MATTSDAASARGETEKQRIDRNLYELMAELRVALPGVQVLFAFLLILPFNRRFEQVTPFGEKVYLATVVCTAISSLLLIAPTMQHRMLFRRDEKLRILRYSQRLAIGGLAFLALGMTGALLLVTNFVFGTTTAAIITATVACAFAVLWFALPWSAGRR